MIFIDTETRSRRNLKRVGGRVYTADESTELLCCVALDVRTSPAVCYVWSPWPGPLNRWQARPEWLMELHIDPSEIVYAPPLLGSDDVPEPILQAARDGVHFCAHNAPFDRGVMSGLGLPATTWVDTVALCRRRGLPGDLERVGLAVFGRGKDKTGQLVMQRSWAPRRKRGEDVLQPDGRLAGRFLDPDGPRLSAIVRYCVRDVLLMAQTYFIERFDEPHVDDAVMHAHEAIDRRGVAVDIPLARLLLAVDRMSTAAAIERANTLSPEEPPPVSSPVALPVWLKARGVKVANCQAPTMRAALEEVQGEAVRAALEARLAFARVTKGKSEAVLNRTCADGRLRGALAYWAAHTGRWGGRGFQPQNLTRPVPSVDYDSVYAQLEGASAEAAAFYLRRKCEEHGCSMGALLSSLLRGVIISGTGKLAACDYSAVEARGLLWLAGDEAGLDVYRRFDATGGADPYMHMGAGIYGIPAREITKEQRLISKVASLACGYGGSVGAFEAMATGYGLDTSGFDIRQIVDAWRDSHHLVAGARKGGFANEDGEWIITRRGGLWKDLERAARLAIDAPRGVFTAGRCTWRMDGSHLICTLPSGRPLVYRDARIEDVRNKWGDIRPTITYFGRQKGRSVWGRVETRGAVLCENACQAMTRDLMADALVQLEAVAGVDVVLTVHDELLAEVQGPEGLRAMERCMLNSPAWAVGLPLAVEGHVKARYGKA